MSKYSRGIITQAAKELKITRATVYRRLDKRCLRTTKKVAELQNLENEQWQIADQIQKNLQKIY